jgi:phosphorylcholine metabolism protein LicD
VEEEIVKMQNSAEEERCGFKVTAERKKIWQAELDLLEKLSEVCAKNDIKFFADAGTLLGAIRHGGFIPWDDDIDVVMMRGEYEKFIKCADQFSEPYFLQSWYTEKKYFRGHAQLRNGNTTAILEGERKFGFGFNQGIFIDIFVLDAVPDDKTELTKEARKIKLYDRLIRMKFYHTKKNSPKGLIKTAILKFVDADKLFLKKEKILKSHKIDENNSVAPLAFIFETEKRIRSKKMYEKTVLMDFEGMKIPCPAEYDDFLTRHYGADYMTPKNLPTTHGGVFFDTEKSWKEYCGKIAQTVHS